MRTYTFAQAQAHYDNMRPEDCGDPVDCQYEFDSEFFRGQLVMTPWGTGIVTGEHNGEEYQAWDEDGYTTETRVVDIQVAIPRYGKEFFKIEDIEVRTKDGRWVPA